MKRMLCILLCLCLFTPIMAFAKSGTLLVAFGTTMPEAVPAITAIHDAFTKEGHNPLLMAYTSDIIRNKLAKQGKPVFSVKKALAEMAKKGVTNLTIQSLHILPAEEYMQLERMVIAFLTQNPNTFKSVKAGYPMLVSQSDLDRVVALVLKALPKERKPKDAVVLMAHGNNRGPGDLEIFALATAFQQADPKVWLTAVEGAHNFDSVLEQLKKAGVKRVYLQPFMIVAGDHARNDLAGPEEDSWASRIQAAGMTAVPILKGLGELEGIQQLFIDHANNAVVDLANLKKAD